MPFGFSFSFKHVSLSERGQIETLPSSFPKKIVLGLAGQAKIERCREPLVTVEMHMTDAWKDKRRGHGGQ